MDKNNMYVVIIKGFVDNDEICIIDWFDTICVCVSKEDAINACRRYAEKEEMYEECNGIVWRKNYNGDGATEKIMTFYPISVE
jgi:hypothetical protein